MGSLRSLMKKKTTSARFGAVVVKRCQSDKCRDSLIFMRKIAFLDGGDENQYEIWLHWACEKCHTTEDIQWPENWPNYVKIDFVESQGYKIVI
jgi:hypothetical protein